jgi:hypothetical protein
MNLETVLSAIFAVGAPAWLLVEQLMNGLARGPLLRGRPLLAKVRPLGGLWRRLGHGGGRPPGRAPARSALTG